jgi:hypothetical protein
MRLRPSQVVVRRARHDAKERLNDAYIIFIK